MQCSVTEWLDTTALAHPHKVAIVDQSSSIDFADLRKRSLMLARTIIAAGVQNKRPIPIYLPKSIEMVIAFFATAYAGCFYSPIDTEMPAARVQKIINTLSTDIVITDSVNSDRFKSIFKDVKVILCDKRAEQLDDTETIVQKRRDATVDTDLLYVMFTSGSTGSPKGVCISHRSVIDYIDWVVEEFHISHEDKLANQAPFYFDNSVLDIYCMMKSGAELQIIPHGLFSQPYLLLQYLIEHKTTTIFWVPSALILVARVGALAEVDLNATMKRVMFAGEVMPTKHLNAWRKHLPNALFANLYGPTEITVDCTFFIVDRELQDEESLPIGHATPNTSIYVLDGDRLISPDEPGNVGELCVRGTCLSLGYYGDPERTASVFVQNPLERAYPEKIYRTGDLVKYDDRGDLIFVGRKDLQIKHLGHRIELGEIESAASAIDGVFECCCLYDHDRGSIELFVSGIDDHHLLRKKLKEVLPAYMVPAKITAMDDLPKNANGKIDRHALRRS